MLASLSSFTNRNWRGSGVTPLCVEGEELALNPKENHRVDLSSRRAVINTKPIPLRRMERRFDDNRLRDTRSMAGSLTTTVCPKPVAGLARPAARLHLYVFYCVEYAYGFNLSATLRTY